MNWLDTIRNLLGVGEAVLDLIGIDWLDSITDNWRDRGDEVRAVIDPYLAAMSAALAGEGLLGAAIQMVGGADLADDIVERIYEVRRPFQAQMTSVLQQLGLEPRGGTP